MSGDGRLSAPRVGIGYDSHRFAPPGPLILGGVPIPSDVHLDGHSDGDAVAHAVTDAILGAAARATSARCSPIAIRRTRTRFDRDAARSPSTRVAALGWRVHRSTSAIVAEKPKIAPHRELMRDRLAAALGIDASTT